MGAAGCAWLLHPAAWGRVVCADGGICNSLTVRRDLLVLQRSAGLLLSLKTWQFADLICQNLPSTRLCLAAHSGHAVARTVDSKGRTSMNRWSHEALPECTTHGYNPAVLEHYDLRGLHEGPHKAGTGLAGCGCGWVLDSGCVYATAWLHCSHVGARRPQCGASGTVHRPLATAKLQAMRASSGPGNISSRRTLDAGQSVERHHSFYC